MGVTIYKVLTGEQWLRATEGELVQAPVDVADGYVHFSTATTLQGTLDKWFEGQDDCVLLAFDASAFGDTLRWEPSRGGELFPHVYGDVWAAQATARWPLLRQPDGTLQVPDLS
jgi:uncharacterized protein (DUF952 family)